MNNVVDIWIGFDCLFTTSLWVQEDETVYLHGWSRVFLGQQ